ncbi:MAG: HNH endonuclease signature motif containing protein [Bacteroidales bacterium]|nr:HNH endonuclease signature motif containing protein [Bacteroidales bacterium]
MRAIWTTDRVDYLIKHYPIIDTHELAEYFNTTYVAVRTKAKHLGLKKANGRRKIWYGEKLEFLTKVYANSSNDELGKLFGVTAASVSAAACKFGLKKSDEYIKLATSRTQFKKGLTPANKGKKMDPEVRERVKHTFFKPGQIPKNYRPVGSERITVDGYIEVKIKDPRTWAQKHRVIWEKHNGKIPKGYNVQFRDGNRQNVALENLYLISRNEQINQNTIQRYPQELQKAIKLNHKLNRKIKQYEQNQY